MGDSAGAIGELGQAIAIAERLPTTPRSLYDLACYRSMLAGVASRPDSGKSREQSQSLALAAVAALRKSIEAGIGNVAHMKADTDFDPLRSRADFGLMMMDVSFPGDAFAR
jgi:hypothetical protein